MSPYQSSPSTQLRSPSERARARVSEVVHPLGGAIGGGGAFRESPALRGHGVVGRPPPQMPQGLRGGGGEPHPRNPDEGCEIVAARQTLAARTVLLIIWVWVDHSVFVLILTHSLTEYHQQNRWSSIPCRYVSFRVRQRALLLKLMPKWKQPFGESPVKQLCFSRHFTQVFTVAGGTNATGDTDLQVWTGAVRLWLAEASSWMSRFASRRIRACEGILDPK